MQFDALNDLNLVIINDMKKIEKILSPLGTASATLSLYYYPACPYCYSVLQVLDNMCLDIERCNIAEDTDWLYELMEEGGRSTVPCLRIENPHEAVIWMYESYDIIDYLQQLADKP